MKLFLWNQRDERVESRELLRRAILEYLTQKQNTDEYRESKQDSLFEFAPEELVIREIPGGKPIVVLKSSTSAGIECSVTHTGDWWLCTVGSHPSGLDAELRSRIVNPTLERRICTADEQIWLKRAGELRPEGENERLLWLWVRKEAYVKYLGTGIGKGLNTFSVFKEGSGEEVQRPGYRMVDLRAVSDEAADELVVVAYCPEEEIESVEWLK